MGPRSFARNGQYFPRPVVRTPATRICLDCLRQDARISGLPHQIGMAFRSDWQVPFLRACPRHNRALVEVWTDSDRTRRHDFATRIGLVMPQIMTGDLDTPALPVSP
ncbi:TniQ family protein [Rhodobacter capsulatus]|uniref:TniQ family protein n=1 Tax=Rhodobacter capsulatus TaxID=1061 RepID=UPI0003D34D6F|nr:TniQ family protein [Rhodobacter capsulatus]ETD89390.1 hypothetical protein U713_10075 [Rhodobacter capsulatus YW2]